jgi:hypothetical protein
MTVRTKTELKALFETGDTLSQTSFEDLIDSLEAALVSGTSIKTINSESLLGGGNIAIAGAWPQIDSTVQTANFNFGSASRIVPISLSGGNIVGTLPAVPFDGQICGVVSRGVNGGSSNRFTFGLNGRIVDGSPTTTVTRTTSFENNANGSNASQALVTELGATSWSTAGGAGVEVWNNGGRTGLKKLLIYTSTLTIVLPITVNGTFSAWLRTSDLAVTLNGVSQVVPPFVGFYQQQLAVALPNTQSNTVAITSFNNSVEIDDLSLSGMPGSMPADWTDVNSRNVGPQGIAIWQWSAANSTWHQLLRRQLN